MERKVTLNRRQMLDIARIHVIRTTIDNLRVSDPEYPECLELAKGFGIDDSPTMEVLRQGADIAIEQMIETLKELI